MITFYPRDIGMWRNSFSFDITLGFNPDKPKYRFFHDRQELIDFLKKHGVKLNDPKFPLEFLGPREHDVFGTIYDVKQWTVIGWIKDELI